MGRPAFRSVVWRAIRSRLEPVKKVARMLKSRLANILTYCKSQLTNGPFEGLNNKIQGLIKQAEEYRNRHRFITDIYFHGGRLELNPAQKASLRKSRKRLLFIGLFPCVLCILILQPWISERQKHAAAYIVSTAVLVGACALNHRELLQLLK